MQSSENIATITACLEQIDPASLKYDEWLKVGCAIKNEGGSFDLGTIGAAPTNAITRRSMKENGKALTVTAQELDQSFLSAKNMAVPRLYHSRLNHGYWAGMTLLGMTGRKTYAL